MTVFRNTEGKSQNDFDSSTLLLELKITEEISPSPQPRGALGLFVPEEEDVGNSASANAYTDLEEFPSYFEQVGVVLARHNSQPIVKLAPLQTLITLMYTADDKAGSVPKRQDTFLLTYRTYLNSSELLKVLTDQFLACNSDSVGRPLFLFSFGVLLVLHLFNQRTSKLEENSSFLTFRGQK